TQESDRWRSLDMLFGRLESDMRQAIPRGARTGARSEPPWVGVAADSAANSALAFTRAGPEFAVEPGIAGQRIGYRLRDGTIEAQELGLGGVQGAGRILFEDRKTAANVDTLAEPWALPLPATPLENGSIEGSIVDAQGLLNVNNLAPADSSITPDAERARFVR